MKKQTKVLVADDSFLIFGMQKVAVELGCVGSVVSLSGITTKIIEVL